MAGHYGSAKTTVQSLDVARIDLEDNLILIKGAIPGSIGSFVKITPSIKGGHSFTVPAPVAEEAAAPVDAPVEEAAAPVEEAAAPVEEAEAAPVEEAKEEAAPEKKLKKKLLQKKQLKKRKKRTNNGSDRNKENNCTKTSIRSFFS